MLTVTTEGMLAVLNDTIFRPVTFNGTLSELVTSLLNNHNSQVAADKQIAVGNITVSDDYLYRAYENYETTMSRLNDLVDSYGGYLSIRYDDGAYILDWLEEYTEEATQSVDFGKNLLDISQESDASDIITVLIPLGAEQELEDGTRKKLTIAELQQQLGKDYIEDATGISVYGRIVGTYEWSDVTSAANLLSKGTAYLHEKILGNISINVGVVDLAGLDLRIDSFKVGTLIYAKSAPHNIASWFTCNQQKLDLLNEDNNKLQLGSFKNGYVSTIQKKQRNYQNKTDTIELNYARGSQMAEAGSRISDLELVVSEQSTKIEQTEAELRLKASTVYVDQLSGRMTTVESELAQNSELIGLYFGQGGRLSTWFTFDVNKFQIGKSNSPIHSEQDNESYKFVNDSGQVLLEINPTGTISQTVNVNAQVRYLDGATPQWATRKGKYIANKGVNLNDLWIGG